MLLRVLRSLGIFIKNCLLTSDLLLHFLTFGYLQYAVSLHRRFCSLLLLFHWRLNWVAAPFFLCYSWLCVLPWSVGNVHIVSIHVFVIFLEIDGKCNCACFFQYRFSFGSNPAGEMAYSGVVLLYFAFAFLEDLVSWVSPRGSICSRVKTSLMLSLVLTHFCV